MHILPKTGACFIYKSDRTMYLVCFMLATFILYLVLAFFYVNVYDECLIILCECEE